jgi:hypothetical protein
MVDVMARWRDWYEAFEQCAVDDRWDRLAPFLSADVQYRVTGMPYACVLKGVEQVIAGFAKSFEGFDRRFDTRTHQVVGMRVFEPGLITARIWGTYEKDGLPPLAFPATGHWHFDGDQIGLMVDVYDIAELELAEAFEWLGAHGEAIGGLDASYA